jgi:hypothetical protein
VGQRVERDTALTYQFAAAGRALRACIEGVPVDPADLDAHNWLYDHLQVPINDAPALFGNGDEQVLALVRCGRCRAVVGELHAQDARRRGGPLVYDVLTQHPPTTPGGPVRQVYVVLGAPGDPAGRPPIPRPATVLTTCRAHGLLSVSAEKLVGEGQRVLSALKAGTGQRQPVITARPVR